jgi:hypothetical protein
MTEETWTDYRQFAFGDPYMVWHDGPDFSQIREQWKTEPERVERMLLKGLEENDELAPQAIGELHDVAGDAEPRFEAALRAAIEGSYGGRKVRIAEALRTFTGAAEWDRYVGDALDQPNMWGEHITAAMALKRATPSDALIEVLQRGVQNEEYLVRYHSANTLSSWAGGAAIETRDELFGDLVAEEAPKRWRKAADELAAAAHKALPT